MRVLLVSPTHWGALRLSKHHYARELARLGHDVTFLNPPSRRLSAKLAMTFDDGVRIATFRPPFPMRTRKLAPRVYGRLMGRHLRRLSSALGGPWDLLWCFEPDAYPDLRWFDASARLYHVVDQIVAPAQALVGQHADVTIAVSPSIAARLRAPEQKVLVIPHGLSSEFAAFAREALQHDEYCPGRPINIGYSGNLWIHSLDRPKLRTVISDHPDVVFHFWGPVRPEDSNVGVTVTRESQGFLRFLETTPNVQLHGLIAGSALPAALAQMDALLLCYNLKADQNAGANSHKILEYLATGRVVVGNRVSDFAGTPSMIEAPADDSDAAFSALFAQSLQSLRDLNSEKRRRERLLFALERTYERHIREVEALIRARGVA